MAILRILAINAADSRTIKAKFSANLNTEINSLNVLVQGLQESTPDALVRDVTISKDIIIINILPLTPFAKYRVIFQSTQSTRFSSADNRDFLIEDGTSNVAEVIGAEDPNNTYRDSMVADLIGQPYVPERGTIVRNILNQLSTGFAQAEHDIKRAKNDNYLSFFVTDERKRRSYGPYDRFNEEGCIEVLRVGKKQTNQVISGIISYDSFPEDIITLQKSEAQDERLEAGIGIGTFDAFILSTQNYPVIKLNSVSILYQNGNTYHYDIRRYGYQVLDSKYDTDFSSTYLLLESNQFKLSEEVLNDPEFVLPGAGDEISIDYEYKSLGKLIDPNSVEVFETLDAIREGTPAITNEFSLAHAPIVNSSNEIPTSGGVQFLDPNSNNPFKTTHPAFVKEIPFRVDAIPQNIGEYSIDYNTGRVFVFGEDANGDGTGYFPPAATYIYKNIFREGLDYTYRSETSELVASPLRDLAGKEATIRFLYENNLVENIDYKTCIHKEELSERIENRLLSSNSLLVKNAPITNVFRILNETTGEIYRINRFNNDKIVFSANTPPSIQTATLERSSFKEQINEQLIVQSEFTNILGTKIFKINLLNQNIISATEDVIGSSYNSSVYFSRNDVFENELFYESQILEQEDNTDKLNVGDYQIDYRNGIVYLGVSVSQDYSLGTINYKSPIINPDHSHVISVSNVYYSINPAFGISKQIDYNSFGEGFITPTIFDLSDERFLNSDITIPYTVSAGNITVQDDIKTVRHVFDNYDLLNSVQPTDFGLSATSDANIIILDSDGVEVSAALTVDSGLILTVPTGSPGISLYSVRSVVRNSDNAQLIDGYESISGNDIILSGSSGANIGDEVTVIYNVVLNSGATPIVDYDRGEHFIDYTYLADEIIVSYEYGDNSLDFRESTALEPGEEYFVSYRVGALRDSLLDNFGSMMQIPELNTFDVNLERERYRDALIGALQSFTKGPTNPSMKSMISEVTKIDPQIIESVFQYWALGISPLYQNEFKLNPTDVDRVLVPGIFDNGFMPTVSGDFISFPVSSNLRLNEGTLQMDIIPLWDGLDNDAILTFSNLKVDGYDIDSSKIFIGSSSYNPDSAEFNISRHDNVVGLPSAIHTNTGIFIYYDDQAKRWQTLVKFNPADGYSISGTITSSGEVYDVKPITAVFDSDDIIRSRQNSIEFIFNINNTDLLSPDGYSTTDGYMTGYSFDGLSFMADSLHYFFDFADTESTNRFSLYKDGRGYLNFVIWGRSGVFGNPNYKQKYQISHDIQNWESGEHHNIAISWKLNTIDKRDEMHLFVDGEEVPNIIRYGGIPASSSTDRFRTVVPEVVAGTVPNNAVAGTCITTLGSNIITGNSVDFGIQGIVPGNTIQIQEINFTTYTITAVNGPNLTLDSNMPASLDDARFTVNPYSVVVSSEIDIYENIAVSTLLSGTETEIPGQRAVIPGYSVSKNSLNQNVLTILGNAEAGSEILIRTLGLNHRRCRERVYLWNDQAVLKTQLPAPINLDEVKIIPVILPYTVIGPDNATVVGPNFSISLDATQVSNITEGRQLEIRISGGNIDFSTAVSVTINGTSNLGATEVLSFTSVGKQVTTNKWMTISSIDVVCKPFSLTSNSCGIEVKEAYSVTYPNGNNIYPVIRFGYQTQSSGSLEGDGSDIVQDFGGFFPASDVGNILVIESPGSVAGTYTIQEKIDNNTVRLNTATGTSFTSGTYKTYNISIGRSGFQNGFFFLERAGLASTPYDLPQGFYEFDYSTYLEIPFDTTSNLTAYIGSDFNGEKQANAIIDEFRILSTALTDTRVGETIGSNEESITTVAQRISALDKTPQTLVLLDFNSFPIQNSSDYYTFADRKFLQSSNSVNDNFGQSIVFNDSGISFDNKNRLTTETQGSIEFWVSPMFDTYNDPVPRVYFDAASSVVESVTSLTKASVKIQGRIGEVLSVRLASDTMNTGTDYFVNGSVSSDFQTINLGSALPFQKTPVVVTYVPSGLNGDRLTIMKDSEGFISFNVIANNQHYQVRQPVFWARDTWHRIKATFIFNSRNNQDQIRLFVDGEERGSIRFGEGLLFGSGIVFGATTSGVTDQILVANMDFTDIITRFHIGQDFSASYTAKARIDNFRLSNKALNSPSIAGQPTDVNYSTNVNCIYPVIENAYTTMLLNFDSIIEKVQDFAILRDSEYGIFNFTLNIIDSFRIVESSQRVQDMLEAMINVLKPANAKAEINYIR